MHKDFIDILREIRGSAAPGQAVKDGIWYELTKADKNGNPGIYGDILALYGIISEGSPTLLKAKEIVDNLTVELHIVNHTDEATSELIDGVLHIRIPRGEQGADGFSGLTPIPKFFYNEDTGMLEYEITYERGSEMEAAILEW